jgi:hypothetical protein
MLKLHVSSIGGKKREIEPKERKVTIDGCDTCIQTFLDALAILGEMEGQNMLTISSLTKRG